MTDTHAFLLRKSTGLLGQWKKNYAVIHSTPLDKASLERHYKRYWEKPATDKEQLARLIATAALHGDGVLAFYDDESMGIVQALVPLFDVNQMDNTRIQFHRQAIRMHFKDDDKPVVIGFENADTRDNWVRLITSAATKGLVLDVTSDEYRKVYDQCVAGTFYTHEEAVEPVIEKFVLVMAAVDEAVEDLVQVEAEVKKATFFAKLFRKAPEVATASVQSTGPEDMHVETDAVEGPSGKTVETAEAEIQAEDVKAKLERALAEFVNKVIEQAVDDAKADEVVVPKIVIETVEPEVVVEQQVEAPTAESPNVVMAHNFKKHGSLLWHNLHDRYFILTADNYLHYYASQDPTSFKAKYLIDKDAAVIVNPCNCFSIVVSGVRFDLIAPSEEVHTAWVSTLAALTGKGIIAGLDMPPRPKSKIYKHSQ